MVAQPGAAHNQSHMVEMLKDFVLVLTFLVLSDKGPSLLFHSTDMPSLNSIVQKAPSFVSRRIADEVILVPTSSKVGEIDCLFALNEVGARIWELIDGERSLKQLRDAILGEFAVSETEAQEDLTVLIEQLKEIGAIQEVS